MRDITTETFEAVLFDNDGTLSDSREAVMRSWTSWAQDHGVAPEAFGNVHGLPSRKIVERVAPHLDLETAVADIDARELVDLEGIVALPGAADALAATAGRSAIVTSAGRDLADLRVGAAGLTSPAVLVTAEDIRHGKPDPEPYLLAAERLGVDPARCLVVEDAPAGVASAKAAGAAVLAVISTSTEQELAGADLIVPDLSHVKFEPTRDGIRVTLRG